MTFTNPTNMRRLADTMTASLYKPTPVLYSMTVTPIEANTMYVRAYNTRTSAVLLDASYMIVDSTILITADDIATLMLRIGQEAKAQSNHTLHNAYHALAKAYHAGPV